MTTSFAYLLRVDRKTVLIILAGLFLCGGLVRFTVGSYHEKSSEIEAKEATLFAQQKSSHKLPFLKIELARLRRENKKAEAFLFHGPNVDTITSTMQIRLQSLISKNGLEPESLRPLSGQSHDAGINTIVIKLRLAGTLENFADFLAAIYNNNNFFLVENCTIKPDKMKGIKVFMDLKAFYDTQENPVKTKTVRKMRAQ